MASWVRDGIGGLQSVVLYSLPELDGAIDTGGLQRCLGVRGGAEQCPPAVVQPQPDGLPGTTAIHLGLGPAVLSSALASPGACAPAVPLGGLVGDNIFLVPERVKRLANRLHKWVALRRTPPQVSAQDHEGLLQQAAAQATAARRR